MVTYKDGRFYYEDIISFKIPNGVQFFNCMGDEELVSGFTFCIDNKYNIIVSVVDKIAEPISVLKDFLQSVDVDDADILVTEIGKFCGVMAIYEDFNFSNCEMILDVPEIEKLLRITFEYEVEDGKNAENYMDIILKHPIINEFFNGIEIEK